MKVSDVQLMMRGHQLGVGDYLRSPAQCASMSGVESYDISALTASYSVVYTNKIIKQTQRKEEEEEERTNLCD
jgi:hypothetical protein